MGIIPDKFIMLNQKDGTITEHVTEKVKNESCVRRSEHQHQPAILAENALLEYKL